jgi:hypothetical protein
MTDVSPTSDLFSKLDHASLVSESGGSSVPITEDRMKTSIFGALAMSAMSCFLFGCGSNDSSMTQPTTTDSGTGASLGGVNPAGQPGNLQTPPTTSASDVESWIAEGAYKAWKCETVVHPQMGVSPHGQNRICANDLTATYAGSGASERPAGSAAVKELLDDSSNLVGYAVSVKTKTTSDTGTSWYWYERVPLDSPAPHDAKGVVADGLGTEGTAKSICVGCHAAAGSDATHSLFGSADFIYLQVSK